MVVLSHALMKCFNILFLSKSKDASSRREIMKNISSMTVFISSELVVTSVIFVRTIISYLLRTI